jgi:hypothetical protein
MKILLVHKLLKHDDSFAISKGLKKLKDYLKKNYKFNNIFIFSLGILHVTEL